MATFKTIPMHHRPTEDEVRERIETIRQYAAAGWIPSRAAANYAINELFWSLGEELEEPPFTEENWPREVEHD